MLKADQKKPNEYVVFSVVQKHNCTLVCLYDSFSSCSMQEQVSSMPKIWTVVPSRVKAKVKNIFSVFLNTVYPCILPQKVIKHLSSFTFDTGCKNTF